MGITHSSSSSVAPKASTDLPKKLPEDITLPESSSRRNSITNSDDIIQKQQGNRLLLNPDFVRSYQPFMPSWSILNTSPIIVPEMERVIRKVWNDNVDGREDEFYILFQAFLTQQQLGDFRRTSCSSSFTPPALITVSKSELLDLLSQFKSCYACSSGNISPKKKSRRSYYNEPHPVLRHQEEIALSLLRAIHTHRDTSDNVVLRSATTADFRVRAVNTVCYSLLQAITRLVEISSDDWTSDVAVSFLAASSFGMYLMMPTILSYSSSCNSKETQAASSPVAVAVERRRDTQLHASNSRSRTVNDEKNTPPPKRRGIPRFTLLRKSLSLGKASNIISQSRNLKIVPEDTSSRMPSKPSP